MNDFSTAVGIVAAGAVVMALGALALAIVLSVRLRRLQADQQAVLGTAGKEDLVAHAARMQEAFGALHERVEEAAERMEDRVKHVETKLERALTHTALVRYDAYGELSGHQSTTIALLDDQRNGVVLSSITNRDAARLYCKQVIAGEGERELSPEETEAVRQALAGTDRSVVLSAEG